MGKTSRGVKNAFNANNFSALALMSHNRKTAVKQVKHENTKKVAAVKQRSRICEFITITIMSLIVVGIAIFVAYQRMLNKPSYLMSQNCNKLVVLLLKNDSVESVRRVFEHLDYEIVHDVADNWNILWTVTEDPSKLIADRKLKPHQLVNHIPSLSLSLHTYDTKFTLRAFQLPHMKQELDDYVSRNSHKRFIIKDCLVDGVKVEANAINLDASLVVQEYFEENPLLIDDYRFDFGVFFLVSSADPLRIYRYKGDIMSRFGRESSESPKYFCEELTTTALEIPSLSEYINVGGYSIKNAMEEYLMKSGINMTLIYDRIDDAVVKFLLTKLRAMKKPSSNFIQLMRFDFNLDTKMNVHMKHVESAVNFEGNEQLLYDALRLVGAANTYEFKSR